MLRRKCKMCGQFFERGACDVCILEGSPPLWITAPLSADLATDAKEDSGRVEGVKESKEVTLF